jgi:hypothetical protein
MCTDARSCASTDKGSVSAMVIFCILLLGGGSVCTIGSGFLVVLD